MVELIFDKNEDWESRTLCVDESCVGTIGPDRRCRECGKTYDGLQNTDAGVTEKSKAQAEPSNDLKNNIESAD